MSVSSWSLLWSEENVRKERVSIMSTSVCSCHTVSQQPGQCCPLAADSDMCSHAAIFAHVSRRSTPSCSEAILLKRKGLLMLMQKTEYAANEVEAGFRSFASSGEFFTRTEILHRIRKQHNRHFMVNFCSRCRLEIVQKPGVEVSFLASLGMLVPMNLILQSRRRVGLSRAGCHHVVAGDVGGGEVVK